MDTQYIDELKALEDQKEAKSKLAEYGAQFGIVLKKSRTFDGMVKDLEAGLKELADTPMPEDNEGLSISDLIDADNELTGNLDSFGADEAKEDAKLLFDSPAEKPVVVEVVAEKVEHIEPTPLDIVVTPVDRTIPEPESTPTEETFKAPEMFELPETFSPTLIKIGPGAGYCTLPWWIYDWINQNPDWKTKPHSFPHYYGIDTLLSLIYYIKREGQVRIRETRNSRFFVLN